MVRSLLPLFTLLFALHVTAVPTQAQKSTDSSIGIWPFLVGNIDADVDNIIARCKSTGLDTVYLHCWRTTGSQTGELRIHDETGGWNTAWGSKSGLVTLTRFIDKAHAAGLQVVGVVQVFRDGGPFPDDQAHQKHMIEHVLRYLVHSYDVRGKRVYELDGIAFDYIRWFGGNHSPTLVDKFLRDARAEVRTMPLHAFVIAGAYAVDGGSYDNRFRTYAEMRSYLSQNYGQDWESMARVLDVLMPMAYTANGHVYGSNLAYMQGYLDAVARYGRQAINNVQSQCRLVPAIRTWNDTTGTTTAATIDACFKGAMSGGADGTMAFRYYTAAPNASWFTALSNWCNAGPDLPIAVLDGSTVGVGATLDSTRSSSSKHASVRLRARYDADGDGVFESTTVPLGPALRTLSGPGSRIVSVRIEDPNGGSAVTSREIGVPAILTPTAAQVSVANGGNVFLRLNPGVTETGRFYVLLTTLSGTTPGSSFGQGVELPINFDFLTITAAGLLNQPPFLGWFGAINGLGFADASFKIPGGLLPAGWINGTMHVAALDLDPSTLEPRYASNAAAIRIVP